MTTIPASELVRVNPNVLNAGGNALDLLGMVLTLNTRVPYGQVLSFPNDGVSVSNYFGPSSTELTIANRYFNSFDTSTQKPDAILFTQYPATSLSAYLRGGPVNQLTIPQLQALSGTLTIVMDGYTVNGGTINLAAASSFSAAATLIQTGLNSALPTAGVQTASIAANAATSVTGSIAGNVLYVTAVSSGLLVPGATITGTGIAGGTKIQAQLSGTTGGIGSYAVNNAQTVASTTITASYGVMTVTANTSGTFSPGQTISGTSVTAGTKITAFGTGTGLNGTYYVDQPTVVASTAITAKATPVVVTYDSISGGFVITSGWYGSTSTVAYPTGTLADPIFVTLAKGAVLSQGADAQTPATFMSALTQITQNWASFMLAFDPDQASGSVQRQAFAAWTNSQNKRWAYVARDADVTATASAAASSSLGNILKTANSDGYDPTLLWLDAFVCGVIASIDFEATNGRTTLAFRGQSGMIASVTTATAAQNLIANGYNFYGAYATANQQFLEYQPGSVSGRFQWGDSYVDQIWLNNALQLALMELLQQMNSIPYNNEGYELIQAACMDPIQAGLNAGVIRTGVTLSNLQKAEINNAAGTRIDDVLQLQGWYLQVVDASPIVRQARTSPPINFWYMDGESVQQIVLNSVLVQ
jgi:hypothetical protein